MERKQTGDSTVPLQKSSRTQAKLKSVASFKFPRKIPSANIRFTE